MVPLEVLGLENSIDRVEKIILQQGRQLTAGEKTRLRETTLRILGIDPKHRPKTISSRDVLANWRTNKLQEQISETRDLINRCIAFWSKELMKHRRKNKEAGEELSQSARNTIGEQMRKILERIKSLLDGNIVKNIRRFQKEIAEKLISLLMVIDQKEQHGLTTGRYSRIDLDDGNIIETYRVDHSGIIDSGSDITINFDPRSLDDSNRFNKHGRRSGRQRHTRAEINGRRSRGGSLQSTKLSGRYGPKRVGAANN